MPPRRWFLIVLLAFILFTATAYAAARPFVIVISKSDLKDAALGGASDPPDDSPEWDEFGDPDSKSEDELDPGSWHAIFEPSFADVSPPAANSPAGSSREGDPVEAVYSRGIRGMIAAVTAGDPVALEEAVGDIEAASTLGYPHAQSALGFLYGSGIMCRQSQSKAFLHHHFAAEGGNMQSKMALAYTYFRQEMYEKAVKLYSELAEAAVASFTISREPPVLEPIRLHIGVEENTEALRKFHGEEDEDFQVIEYQAMRGSTITMHKIGLFYYFGFRGIRRDYNKALYWFSKAADKGDAKSMEFLGEIYASGAGVEKNYTEALLWLTRASKHKHFSAYNGLGYIYTKGLGVEKNYTKAKEYFEKAAGNDEPGGHYNLGVVYLKGIGVKRDIAKASKYFIAAANVGQPKAMYQVAKMFQKGIGFQKNVATATILYKVVAERGPWSSMSRWALESYLKGEVGKSLLLYSRLAELGYEVAQSNAAWILDRYEEQSLCMGESGFCTENERHIHSHSLWWQASEQGNEHAALLIGDAYYYGRGTERDYERAAEAYMRALSQSNAQAMFNLGYMHEHGEGLPYDLHLAKRYYDQALENDPDAKLPVALALTSLWIRKNYAHSFLVHVIDSLPEIFPRVETWVENVLLEEGNATIVTLFLCLLTVLYLRDRQRRQAVVPAGQAEVIDQNRQ